MKTRVLFLGLILFAGRILAQTPEFGVYTEEELSIETVPFEPDASVVALFEIGVSQPLFTATGYSSIVHGIHTQYHFRYKILQDNVLNFGDIRIPFQKGGDLKIEQIVELVAQVSYLENGERVVKELTESDIKLVELDNGFAEYRIIFPNAKKGSILEWKYGKFDRVYYSLEGWAFQGEYPKLKSYFGLKTPLFLQYQLVMQGKNVREALYQSEKRDLFYWEINNINSFRSEPYIINPLDYLDRVEGFLSRDGSQGDQIVYSTWAELGNQIQSIKSFASYFKGNSLRKIGMKEGFTGGTSLEIAKNAYQFVSNEFELVPSVYALPTQTTNDLVKSKKGNHLDINLLLLVILKEYGIKSNLVLTNKKGENRTNLIPSPFLDQFSSSLIRAEIEGKTIWLDGTDKALPFGLISPKKLMPQGFLIDGESSSLIPIDLSHDSGFELYVTIGKDSIDQFEYRTQAKVSGLSVLSIKESENQQEENVEVDDIYDIEIEDHFLSEGYISSKFKRPAVNHDEDILIFDPFDQSIFYQNLFLDEIRLFTIEFEYLFNEKIMFTLEIPEGYALDEFPQAKNFELKGKALEFTFEVIPGEKEFLFISNLKINSPDIQVSAYKDLQRFAKLVSETLNSPIILKKVSNSSSL